MEDIISGELHDEMLKRKKCEDVVNERNTLLHSRKKHEENAPRAKIKHPKLLRAQMSTNDFLDILLCVKRLSEECREERLITL